MAKDFGIGKGVVAGLLTALSLQLMIGSADIIWSYLPIGNQNETLTEWASRTTGVA